MTTDADRLAEVEVDPVERHRSLRQQYVAQMRMNGDGHNRRAPKSTSKAELRRRRARRKQKQRARTQAS